VSNRALPSPGGTRGVAVRRLIAHDPSAGRRLRLILAAALRGGLKPTQEPARSACPTRLSGMSHDIGVACATTCTASNWNIDSMRTFALLLLISLANTQSASAQQIPPPGYGESDGAAPAGAFEAPAPQLPAPQDSGLHRFSFTFSPIHLLLPLVEVAGEFALGERAGLAAIFGVGKVQSFSAFEIGSSFRYYVIGDFDHGMQLGAEALYVLVDGSSGGTSAVGAGLAVGPFIGYKIIASVGFTFDAQLGFQYIAVRAESGSASAETSDVIPLLNLNIGWSF